MEPSVQWCDMQYSTMFTLQHSQISNVKYGSNVVPFFIVTEAHLIHSEG